MCCRILCFRRLWFLFLLLFFSCEPDLLIFFDWSAGLRYDIGHEGWEAEVIETEQVLGRELSQKSERSFSLLLFGLRCLSLAAKVQYALRVLSGEVGYLSVTKKKKLNHRSDAPFVW